MVAGRAPAGRTHVVVFEDGPPLLDVTGLDAVAEHVARLADPDRSASERR